jgi:ribosomal protein L23
VYEYYGQLDPTSEVNRKVSKEEMAARVSQMYSGKVKVKKCLRAHSLKRPADPVRSWDLSLGHCPLLS